MRNVKVYCQKCKALIYEYMKNKPGHLVKCYKDRIIRDYADKGLKCSKCGKQFAREAMIRGKPANKIIQGKVFVKR